jgi:outer membrane protein TolC
MRNLSDYKNRIEIFNIYDTLSNAKNSYVQYLYDYQLARIRLIKSIGTL